MCSANRWRRQTRLLRQRHHFNGRSHNFQNTNQQHPLHRGRRHDDDGLKYVGKQHAEHLRNDILRTYELTTDWTATVYSGMTLKWDYDKRTCDISMPGYV
jgi:hypothetical protein